MRRIRRMAALATAIWMVLAMMGSGAAAMTMEETVKGSKVARRTWTEDGATVNGPEGYAYVTYTYSDATVTERYYTADDKPFKTLGGYYVRTLTYGNRHRLTEISYYDPDGNRMVCRGGYARVRIGYTAKGQVTNVNYYGTDNRPVNAPFTGYASLKNDYRGVTLTQTAWQDVEKKAVNGPGGYAALIQTVNKENKITGIRFVRADGSAATCEAGWSASKRELDKNGRTVAAVYTDASGEKVNTAGGYAEENWTWESELIYTLRRYDAAGEPLMIGEECAAVRRETDKDGRVIRESYLSESGGIAHNRHQAGATVYTYDEAGRICGVALEDGYGNAITGADGWAAYRDTLDENGFVTKRVYLGTDGNAVNTAEGFSEIRYMYDETGRISSTAYLDADGNPVAK